MDNRIKLNRDSRERFFVDMSHDLKRIPEVARIIGVHPRTIRDWRRGKYTIPKRHFIAMLKLMNRTTKDYVYGEIPAAWHASEAGKRGGRSYMAKYGVLGTKESRSAGGRASYLLRKDRSDDIFSRKAVVKPLTSSRLAEFVGIMIGDGTIGEYQASVVLDTVTDREYATYISILIESLFGIKPAVQLRPKQGCVAIVMSSVELTDYLAELGLPRGNKLRAGLDIPSWITNNTEYSIACIRGIFDTDGSIFQEKHVYKDKKYAYCRLAFVSSSPSLRTTLTEKLNELGMHAQVRGNRNVILERFTDVEKYFKIVGSSNPKHLSRWTAFGGVG